MSSSVYILRKSSKDLGPIIPNYVTDGCYNIFQANIVKINNFASVMQYKLLIVYKLFLFKFTSPLQLVPN